MTLITEKIGQDNARRCDAKCYNATHPDCDCVCGGRNHGAGKQQAIETTRRYTLQILEHYDQTLKVKDGRIEIAPLQGSLPL